MRECCGFYRSAVALAIRFLSWQATVTFGHFRLGRTCLLWLCLGSFNRAIKFPMRLRWRALASLRKEDTMNSKRTGMGFRTLALLASILAASFCAALLNAQQNSGTFVSIDFPNALFTNALGINPEGDIVGFYLDSSGTGHGYLLSGGHFTSIDFPGAIGTLAADINPSA